MCTKAGYVTSLFTRAQTRFNFARAQTRFNFVRAQQKVNSDRIGRVVCPYRDYNQHSYNKDGSRYKLSISSAAVPVLVAGSFFSDDKVDNLKKNIGMATMHLHQAEPALAKPHFEAAFKLLQEDLDRSKGTPIPSMQTVYLMDQLGNIALQLECYKEAVKLYLATINGFALNGIERSNRTVTELFLKVGQIYAIIGEYKLAEMSFLHCVEVTTAELTRTGGKKNPDVVELAGLSYEGLGKVYLSMNFPENALNMYKHALEFADRVLGPNAAHVPVLLSDLATVYESMENYELALKHVEDAISKAKVSNKAALPAIMCNKASITMFSGDLKEARTLYEELYQICFQRKDDETLREIRANLKILEEKEKLLNEEIVC